jgi:hypothetical protein
MQQGIWQTVEGMKQVCTPENINTQVGWPKMGGHACTPQNIQTSGMGAEIYGAYKGHPTQTPKVDGAELIRF